MLPLAALQPNPCTKETKKPPLAVVPPQLSDSLVATTLQPVYIPPVTVHFA